MKITRKKLKTVYFAIVVLSVIGICIFTMSMKSSALTATVSNETEFLNAVNAINNSGDPTNTINITNNISLSRGYEISYPVVIRSATGVQHIISMGDTGTGFNAKGIIIESYSTLTFMNLRIERSGFRGNMPIIYAWNSNYINCVVQNVTVFTYGGDTLLSGGRYSNVAVGGSGSSDIINAEIDILNAYIPNAVINIAGNSPVSYMTLSGSSITVNFYTNEYIVSYIDGNNSQINLYGHSILETSLEGYVNISVNNNSKLILFQGDGTIGKLEFNSNAAVNLGFGSPYAAYTIDDGIYGVVRIEVSNHTAPPGTATPIFTFSSIQAFQRSAATHFQAAGRFVMLNTNPHSVVII